MNDQEIVRAAGEAGMGWEFHKGSPITMTEDCWYDDSGTFMFLVSEWNPLTRLDHAGMLIDAMRREGWLWCGLAEETGFLAYLWRHGKTAERSGFHPTLSCAITMAALRALEVPNA